MQAQSEQTSSIRQNLQSALFVLVFFLAPYLYVCFHQTLSTWLPSVFHAGLKDGPYSYWHRWIPLSAAETLSLGLTLYIVCQIVYLYVDPVYRFFHNMPASIQTPMLGLGWALCLGMLVYSDLFGGYAIATDHLVVRSPFRDISNQTYAISDINRVEIGCHERIDFGRHSPNWRVPSYKIVLKDGDSVSPFDLADSAYRDPKLMQAVLDLDTQVRAQGISKIYRKDIFGNQMNNPDCILRMKNAYDSRFRSRIQDAFTRQD